MAGKSQARGNEARARIYECVSRHWRTGQAAPTIREIAAEVGLSVATVHRHIRILVGQEHLKGRGRTLRPWVVT
jgi:DNA-binding transcriptional regulator YhcF (GntR family)